MDRASFEQRVWQHWADRYACTVADLKQPSIELLTEEDFTGVHVWHLARRAFVRYEPACQPIVKALLKALGSPASLEPGQLTSALNRVDASVDRTERAMLSYLYPPDFRPAAAPDGMAIRQLTLADAPALAEVQAACGAAETDEAEVSVEDEIAFGCFAADRLVAVATGFRIVGFMDIGVITHPGFRRRGLGQAVVSTLCAWCLDRDILLQYRNGELNTASHKLAQGLGFVTLARSEHIFLKSGDHAGSFNTPPEGDEQ